MSERLFIDSIRLQYSGLQDLPRESLASSVKTLADDLYAKDTHFIFELIQNAEDNDYAPNKSPSLRFEVCQKEIDGEFGPVLIVHNNETGFQEKNVRAICQVGKSTKKKAQGYIGEKGIGFKSVFRVTKRPYITSNHFQFCLPEEDEETGLGYIVPRWVVDPPVKSVAGETTIVLPLNKDEDDVFHVVNALRDIAPETILFLKNLTSIEISVHLPDDEHEIAVEKRILAELGESRLVELTYAIRSADGDESLESSQYWLTEIEFPKPAHIYHEKRKDIESRTVSVAIPLGPNAHEGKLFAYLPVWETTGLPFLVNADFLLVSSREGVREDEPWNKWLRDCIAETYSRAFLDLLNAAEVPLETKVLAYGTIPLESYRSFLKPIIKPVQKFLTDQKCVLVLPNNALVAPSKARLCPGDLRDTLHPPDRLPRYLREDAFLVHLEIEDFSEQLKTIGVPDFLLSEIVSCLEDGGWVQDHPTSWFVDLFRYLSTQEFEPEDLRHLPIVPVAPQNDNQTRRLSWGAEQPLYFSCSDKDRLALGRVPDWLSKLAPIAFLDAELVSLLNRQEDVGALGAWLTNTLNVYPFSLKNYCVDVFSKLIANLYNIKDSELIEATMFLVQEAGSLHWENLPLILADDRRISLAEIQKPGKDTADRVVQGIVVPESYNSKSGWQHIWITEQDRRHFVVLSPIYPREIVQFLINRTMIGEYPPPQKVSVTLGNGCTAYEQSCLIDASRTALNAKITNYRSPSCLISKTQIGSQTSKALIEWLKSSPLAGSGSATISYEEIVYYNKRSHYVSKQTKSVPSELILHLRESAWLPSTKGLVSPFAAFFPTQSIKEVLGDTVPYVESVLPEPVLLILGVKSEITVAQMLPLLRDLSRTSDASTELTNRIYLALSSRISYASFELGTVFQEESLILTVDHNGHKRWNKTGECIWEDASLIFGDRFRYLASQYPRLQDFFVEQLGVQREINIDHLLDLLLNLSHQLNVSHETVTRIYSSLNDKVRSGSRDVRNKFGTNPLILVTYDGKETRWLKMDECVWEDAHEVLGNDFAYLINHYPSLQEFFVERVGVKRRADAESFAKRWLYLQKDPVADVEQRRVLVDRLYREIKPVTKQLDTKRPEWWLNFSREVNVYTQSDRFERPTKVVLPDDGEMREVFRESAVEFAWRPEKDSFSEWLSFYEVFGTPLLSESVTSHLKTEVNTGETSSRQYITDAAIKMIAAWLRERRRDAYDLLLNENVFAQLVALRELETSDEISVEFRLETHTIANSKTTTYPVFWERTLNILIFKAKPKKSHIAKVVAKALISNQAYKDLATWIEVVMGESDTDRLKEQNWSVPQEVLDLFPRSASAPSTPKTAPETTPGALVDKDSSTPDALLPATPLASHESAPSRKSRQGHGTSEQNGSEANDDGSDDSERVDGQLQEGHLTAHDILPSKPDSKQEISDNIHGSRDPQRDQQNTVSVPRQSGGAAECEVDEADDNETDSGEWSGDKTDRHAAPSGATKPSKAEADQAKSETPHSGRHSQLGNQTSSRGPRQSRADDAFDVDETDDGEIDSGEWSGDKTDRHAASSGTTKPPKADGKQATSETPHSGRHSQLGNRETPGKSRQPRDSGDGDEAGGDGRSNRRPSQSRVATGQVDFAAALTKAFNREGQTEFGEEEDWDDDDFHSGRVKNHQRRRDKLAEGYRDNIDNEPSPEARRRTVERNLLEGPNEQVRVALYEWYRGKCQICGETWPKRDGEPYFTAAYLVERRQARWIDEPGNAICLCAKHFVQWRLAAIETPLDIVEQIRSLQLKEEGGNGQLSIDFVLVGKDSAIRYDERHFLALRTLIEVASGSHTD